MLLKFMIDLGSFPETILSRNLVPACLLPGRMLTRLFYGHGLLCATHPWEVLMATLTLTMSLMSVSLWATNSKLCGWNYICQSQQLHHQELKVADILVVVLVRCLAVVYLYSQFRNLRKLGSKYLLGLAGVLTICSSFMFSVAFANLIGFDLNGLSEALPFFILLVDLSKASALARFSLSGSLQPGDFQKSIGSGMALLGPALTLDTLLGALAIGLGTLSGVRTLETLCLFGCLSVVANYLAFMTFYPACLSLVLEISSVREEGKPLRHLQLLARVWQREEEGKRHNPVTQRVKVIMLTGLVLVHAHSRFVTPDSNSPTSNGVRTTSGGVATAAQATSLDYSTTCDQPTQPEIPLWQFYLGKFLTVNLDYGAALLLGIALAVKYVIFDEKLDQDVKELVQAERCQDLPNKANKANNNLVLASEPCANTVTDKHTMPSRPNQLQTNGTKTTSQQQQQNGVTSPHTNNTNNITNGGGASPTKTTNGINNSKKMNSPIKSIDRECLDPKKNDFIPASFFLGGQDDSSSSSEEDNTSGGKDKHKDKDQSTVETHTQDAASAARCMLESMTFELGGQFTYTPKLSEETPRTIDECVAIMNSDAGPEALSDEEVVQLVQSKHIPSYKLETMLADHIRGVAIRRQILSGQLTSTGALDTLPFMHYDYKYVEGSCCENVIGYVPVPVGVAGPLLLDGVRYQVPMATTEGCLVASTNRGCRAIEQSGGASCCVINDGMTRGPVVRFQKAVRASEVKLWLEMPENFAIIKESFDSTSRFARLKKCHIGQAGRNLYIRFVSSTGDAMGMNMLSKGSEKALGKLQEEFPDMEIISLSGNYCTDKKPNAINWIEGRGKSVVAEAIIKSNIVKNTLKTTVPALVELNISKNLVGSAMAGSIGGFNAHASNIVTAIYIAAGQDPAQNVTSSNCLMMMEPSGPLQDDLHITCTMPSIEVGTVGGGTVLPPQSACLKMLGLKGSNNECPGDNARGLARVVCATVMAGELSLMSALAAGHLVKSHLKHNRSVLNMAPQTIKEEDSPKLRHAATAPGMCTNNAS